MDEEESNSPDQLPALKDIHVWSMTYDYVIEDYKERLKDSISEAEEAGLAIDIDNDRYQSILELGSRE